MKAKAGEKPIKFYVVLVRNKNERVAFYDALDDRSAAYRTARLVRAFQNPGGWAKVVKCEVRA